jgi:predicted nucleic acid-binding protein
MRQFFDTNILVYSRDPDAAAKRALARDLIGQAIDQDAFVVSTQVLVEFHATAVRRKLLGSAQALDLAWFWARRDTVSHTPDLVLRGLALHQAHSLSVWDALIVQAGLDAGCSLLFSEDLQHGRRFGELEIVNPFIAPRAHEPRAAAYSAGRVRKRRRVR